MSKKLKIIFSIILVLALAFGMTSCFLFDKDAKRDDLISLTCATVIDSVGRWAFGFRGKDPHILVLEEDSYGRTLYAYMEGYTAPTCISVMQANDGEYAYFYPGVSYALLEANDDYIKKISKASFLEKINSLCTPTVLADIKEKNDWNTPVDLARCERALIKENEMSYGNYSRIGDIDIGYEDFQPIMAEIAEREGFMLYGDDNPAPTMFEEASVHYSRFKYLHSDRYGREIYFIEGSYYHYDEHRTIEYKLEYVFVFNPDGTYDLDVCYREIADMMNYSSDVEALKAANGWNTPYTKGAEK
ncbi:MAG: hypothetical protein IJD79_05295 [Clostridia bacterium]|nr:hypothetical protein [Clostridia bacterium]